MDQQQKQEQGTASPAIIFDAAFAEVFGVPAPSTVPYSAERPAPAAVCRECGARASGWGICRACAEAEA